MRVVVTGAAGFVGSHLTGRLLREGASVVATTRNVARARERLGPDAIACEVDLSREDPSAFLAEFQGGVDAVVHLAASLDYFGSRRELWATNVEATRRLLDWAAHSGVRRFIFASSIEAVGPLRPDTVPGDEASPCRPVSAYGRSKVLAERQLLSRAKKSSPEVVVLRLGNVYGPAAPAFLLPIARAIVKGGALADALPSVSGHTLAAVHVSDVCDAFMRALHSQGQGVFTIVGPRAIPVGEVFERVADVLESRVPADRVARTTHLALSSRRLRHRLRRRADLLDYISAGGRKRTQRDFSIARAERELGYAPQVAVELGIPEVLRRAREQGLLPASRS